MTTIISFGARTPAEKFEEIKDEYLDFKDDNTNARKANNICSNLWHLVDWVWKKGNISKDEFANMGEFRNSLYMQCPNLKILHDICNDHKHAGLLEGRAKASIRECIITGTFDKTFSFAFDRVRLEVVFENESTRRLDVILENVINFWESYFES